MIKSKSAEGRNVRTFLDNLKLSIHIKTVTKYFQRVNWQVTETPSRFLVTHEWPVENADIPKLECNLINDFGTKQFVHTWQCQEPLPTSNQISSWIKHEDQSVTIDHYHIFSALTLAIFKLFTEIPMIIIGITNLCVFELIISVKFATGMLKKSGK